MSIESDLLQTERVGDGGQPAQQEPQEQPQQQAAQTDQQPPPDEDAAFEQQLAEQTIDLPEGEKLVPLSAVTTLRGKLKDAKQQLTEAKSGSERAQQLEQQIARMQQQLQAMAPYVQAYQAAIQQPQPQIQDPPEDTAELEEIAKDFDLYTAEGKPDLTRARRILQREQRLAERIADSKVQPIYQQTVQQRSAYNYQRALNTVLPNGLKPDPQVLRAVWERLDPGITADPEGAKHALIQALGFSLATGVQHPQGGPQRGADGKFAKAEDIPPPLYTERAGGQDTPEGQLPLNEAERRFIKAQGMTEKEYLESAKHMPRGRR